MTDEPKSATPEASSTASPRLSSLRKRVAAVASSNRTERMQAMVDLVATIVMALATIATAWSGYQSALWGGEDTAHMSQAMKAIIRAGEFNNLAMQRIAIHVTLFGQWTGAVAANNTTQAEFLLARFPEPLKTAVKEWRALDPATNPNAPASPFDMPSYVVRERADADRWELVAGDETDAANRAGDISDQYLVYTIIFASVLFFAGISGKFKTQVLDIVVLAIGIVALSAGTIIMLLQPVAR